MCVTCDAKTPSFAPPGSKTARWCKACSVNQPGALLTYRQRCEDCNKSTANWGLRDDPKVRDSVRRAQAQHSAASSAPAPIAARAARS